MKYIDKSIRYYVDSLADKNPTPGGGSVAALMGLLGISLLTMVANVTVAKKSFNGYKERAKRVLKEADNIRRKLVDLIDEDIKAYESLSKAFKRHRTNILRLQPALKKAIMPPAKVCNYVHKASMLCLELSYVGTKAIIPDVSIAIYALDAAFEAALVTVDINLKDIRDKKYKVGKMQVYTELQKDMKKLKTEILSKTKERMFT